MLPRKETAKYNKEVRVYQNEQTGRQTEEKNASEFFLWFGGQFAIPSRASKTVFFQK